MNDELSCQVQTGGDPRQLADFIALREELSKLTHPARPDVDWQRVEQLSLSLFRQNGVELQTVSWYTLARAHLNGMYGLNEGLALLNAMLLHQWGQLWPLQIASRAEILSGLSLRLQNVFRTFTLGHDDLPTLCEAEKLLRSLDDVLARQTLKQVCHLTPLIRQITGTLTRLENSVSQESTVPAIVLNVKSLQAPSVLSASSAGHRLVYVVRPDPDVTVDVVHDKRPCWTAFAGGVCSALLFGAIAMWGWQYVHGMAPAMKALNASVAPLPPVMTLAETQQLREEMTGDMDAEAWLKQASVRLDSLGDLPPDWAQQQGNALVAQAQLLWPENKAVAAMRTQWQQKMAVNAITQVTLTGWNKGMTHLRNLTEQLNALDRQRGKYLTVSELKSQVFAATQAFSHSIPVEEQLRLMSERQEAGMSLDAEKLQTKQHLRQLITYYSALTGTP